jgi:pimeloyl-ACP methyl ester carboxylesterase
VLYEMRKRRGFNRQAMPEHFAAIEVSGSRLEEMNKITCPVLVIHGTADTAIPITHAKKYAALIPDARTLWLEGEGHIIRDRSMPEIMNVLLPLFESAARQ